MWIEHKPKRKVSLTGTLGDIEAHLREGHPYSAMYGDGWHYPPPFPFDGFGSECPVTDTHEGCHGVNADIRNENKVRNGYYCLESRAYLIPTNPDFTLRDLAQAIPKEDRGRSYQLYLVEQQRYWNADPLYPLDELTAYTLGAKAGFELGLEERANYSRDNANEFSHYAWVLASMARDHEFEHQEALDEFLDFWVCQQLLPLCDIL